MVSQTNRREVAWIRSERLVCVFVKTTKRLRIKLVHKSSLCNLRCRDITTYFSFSPPPLQPKCGFLPFSRHITKECKRKVCRFCMHQHYKASTCWESNKRLVFTHGLLKWSFLKVSFCFNKKKKKRMVQCSVNILLSVCTVCYHTISPSGVWLEKMLRKYENQ